MRIIILSIFIIQLLLVSCGNFRTNLSQIKNNQREIKEEYTEKNKEIITNIGDRVYYFNKYEITKTFVYKNDKPLIFPKPYYSSWDGISFDKSILVEKAKDSLINHTELNISSENAKEVWVLNDSYTWSFGNYSDIAKTYFVIENDSINRLSYILLSRNHAFKPPIPVKKVEIETKGKNLFSYELIYLGIQNNSIVLSYREYTEDMLRSNFSQSVYYNVNEIKDNIIQYKNVKFKILDYNNQNIKYMVID